MTVPSLPYLADLAHEGAIPEPAATTGPSVPAGDRIVLGDVCIYRAHGRVLRVQEKMLSRARYRCVGSYLLWGVEPDPYVVRVASDGGTLERLVERFLASGSLDAPAADPAPVVVSRAVEDFMVRGGVACLTEGILTREDTGPTRPGARLDHTVEAALRIIGGGRDEALVVLDDLVAQREVYFASGARPSADDAAWQAMEIRLEAIALLHHLTVEVPDLEARAGRQR